MNDLPANGTPSEAESEFVPFRPANSKGESKRSEFQTAFVSRQPKKNATGFPDNQSNIEPAARDSALQAPAQVIPDGAPALGGGDANPGSEESLAASDSKDLGPPPPATAPPAASETSNPESDPRAIADPGAEGCKPEVATNAAAPKLTFEKDGDSVRLIRVECSCGKTVEIDCHYEDAPPDQS